MGWKRIKQNDSIKKAANATRCFVGNGKYSQKTCYIPFIVSFSSFSAHYDFAFPIGIVQFLGICCTTAIETAIVKAVKKQSFPKCMEICALPIKR